MTTPEPKDTTSAAQIPEWAQCARTGCNDAATHGFLTLYGVNHVCRAHIPDEPTGLQELGDLWWEECSE
jgi:hypothetical protein